MDRFCTGQMCGADNAWDIEVALASGWRTDANGFIRKLNVQRVPVGLGIDGNSLNTHLPAGADDAERDLAAIGDKDFVEHAYATSSTKSGCPYSTGWPFSTRILMTLPAASLSISFMSFIASIMQSVVPLWT